MPDYNAQAGYVGNQTQMPYVPQENEQQYMMPQAMEYAFQPNNLPDGHTKKFEMSGSQTGQYVQQPLTDLQQNAYYAPQQPMSGSTGGYVIPPMPTYQGGNAYAYSTMQSAQYEDQQALYTAPMAPSDTPAIPIPTPQMAREGLSTDTGIHPKVHEGGSKKKGIILAVSILGVIALALVLYFAMFANRHVYTAEDVVTALYQRGLPIQNPIIYTAETDPEGLLGTMNQYTSKVSWIDPNVMDRQGTLERGGIVEVFPSEALAQERLRQLGQMLISQSGAFSQVNRAVLRLSTGFDEDQVTAYQDALRSMFRK